MGTSFQIGNVPVGEGHPVFIIAELSANHAGQRDIALKSIERAAKCGANAIKLQTYTPDTLTLKSNAPHFVVKTKNEWNGRTLHDLYAEAMTPWEWHAELKACAESLGLPLFSTPFDPTAVEFLEALNVPAHKVASFEIVDLPLVANVARRNKPVILSTGMASLGEIEAAVATCRSVGNDKLALLRCVSSYPARPDAMNLQSFTALRSFGTVVGLSDHTRDNTVAIASVTLGAKLIEKHFILDRSVGGPDAFFSLEPDELEGLIKAVRDTERAMGAPRFGVSADEKASAAFRRSLFVARPAAKGTPLTADIIRSVRPSYGLAPEHLPRVLGCIAARDLEPGEPLTWDMVGPKAVRPKVTLRLATAADSDALFAWRNDEETRKASSSTAAVPRADHDAWFARSLDSKDRVLFVAMHEGAAVGTARMDRDVSLGAASRVWEVSLTVAPHARGKGLAAPMLTALSDAALEREAALLLARLKPENQKSRAAFEAAGYHGFSERRLGEETFVFCERLLTT